MQCFVCGVSALLWPWSAAFIMNTYSSLTLMLSVLHSALPIKPSFPLSSSLLLAPQTGNRCPSFPVSVHSREPGQCGYIYSYTRTQQYNTRSPLSRKHIRNREQQRRTNQPGFIHTERNKHDKPEVNNKHNKCWSPVHMSGDLLSAGHGAAAPLDSFIML